MTLPAAVQIGPHRYDVQCDADATVALRELAPDRIGSSDAGALRIQIAHHLHPSQQQDTLLHEILHMLLHQLGLQPSLANASHDDDVEERVVHALAPALLDLLRRNPDLVAYLVADQ